MLRASGVNYDLRREIPYGAYPEFDFDVVTRPEGDSYARYLVRIGEMRESIKIAKQALKKVIETRGPSSAKLSPFFRPPSGEGFSRIESPRGEIGFYIVSNGSGQPYKAHVRAPSFYNLAAISKMAEGLYVADLVALIGSLDPVLGAVDR